MQEQTSLGQRRGPLNTGRDHREVLTVIHGGVATHGHYAYQTVLTADKALSCLASWPSTLRPRGPFGELELDLWKNFLDTGLRVGLARRPGMSECV